jgi:hypothetical protein
MLFWETNKWVGVGVEGGRKLKGIRVNGGKMRFMFR